MTKIMIVIQKKQKFGNTDLVNSGISHGVIFNFKLQLTHM